MPNADSQSGLWTTELGPPLAAPLSRCFVAAPVTVDVSGQTVTSSITMAGLAEIGIVEGSEVVALIKASDVMLAVED